MAGAAALEVRLHFPQTCPSLLSLSGALATPLRVTAGCWRLRPLRASTPRPPPFTPLPTPHPRLSPPHASSFTAPSDATSFIFFLNEPAPLREREAKGACFVTAWAIDCRAATC